MSDLSVSILFRAINLATAPARAVSEAISGVTAATRAATSASQLATQATRNEATGSIAATKAIREQVTATTAATTGNNALAAAANNSATAFARQATEATRAATAAAGLAKVPPPPSIGAPGAPIIPGAPRLPNPRAELDSALMAGMTGTIVGTHLSGIGGMLARPVTESVGVAAQFEATMSGVGAVANATESELRSLNKQARDLGASTAFTATQAAEGMRFLGMAGFRANQIMAAMPATLDMARAGAIDLGRAADISSNILTGFGLEAEKMGRVADVLTQTFTTSNTDLLMLGESMKYVAPIARGLNISLEETAAMVGLLGNAGIQGSQAGTTLRAALLRLAAPRNASEKMLASVGLSADQLAEGANEAASALASLGIESKDSEGNLRPIAELLRDIAAATEEYGQAERAAILSRIFGVEAASGMIELINQAGSGALDAYITRIMESSEGAASRVAKKMGDNFAGAVIEMRSAWEGFQIAVGKPVGNFLTPFVNSFTFGLRVFTKLAEIAPPLTGGISLLIGGLGILLLVLGGLFATGAALLGGLAALKFAFAYLGIPIQAVSIQLLWLRIRSILAAGGLRALTLAAITCSRNLLLLALRGIASVVHALPAIIAGIRVLSLAAIPGLIVGLKALWIAMLTNPIGWIGALIAGLALLIWLAWKPLVAFFKGVWAGFTQQMQPVFKALNVIKTAAKDIFGAIGQPFREVWTLLTQIFPTLKQLEHEFGTFGQAIGTIMGAIVKWTLWPITTLLKLASAIAFVYKKMQGVINLTLMPLKLLMSGIGAIAGLFGLGASAPAIAAPEVSPPAINAPAITTPTVATPFASPAQATATGTSRNRPTVTNAPTPATRAGDTITITINAAPGQDPKAIAAEVARILEARQRHQNRNQLTDYDDNA